MTYDESKRNTILDYLIDVVPLKEKDRVLYYSGMNFSITGNIHDISKLSGSGQTLVVHTLLLCAMILNF